MHSLIVMSEINDPKEVERIADEIIRRYDEIAFAGLNKILELIRSENNDTTGPSPHTE